MKLRRERRIEVWSLGFPQSGVVVSLDDRATRRWIIKPLAIAIAMKYIRLPLERAGFVFREGVVCIKD